MTDLIGKHFGQYEIIGLIGKGGMATVYRGWQASTSRKVAIKIINPELALQPEFLQRFKREVQTLTSLSHPHIVKVFDTGDEDGLTYLVMEFLTGGNLDDRIQFKIFDPKEASTLLDQIASALDYAHAHGIIYCDLKPNNVLLDEQGNAFLTDFGIARMVQETLNSPQSESPTGTPAYMSPEQWRGETLDKRTDIYALGVILFQLLTGEVPFIAYTPYSMMQKHLTESPRSIRRLDSDLQPGIERVILKALAKQPMDRFKTAGNMAKALKAAIWRLYAEDIARRLIFKRK